MYEVILDKDELVVFLSFCSDFGLSFIDFQSRIFVSSFDKIELDGHFKMKVVKVIKS